MNRFFLRTSGSRSTKVFYLNRNTLSGYAGVKVLYSNRNSLILLCRVLAVVVSWKYVSY